MVVCHHDLHIIFHHQYLFHDLLLSSGCLLASIAVRPRSSGFSPGGPAAVAGLRPGDLIVALNGRIITGVDDRTRSFLVSDRPPHCA